MENNVTNNNNSNCMDLWNRWRKVPEEAKKPIKGGRLAGMTDISPMWRMQVLTEAFGPCGTGWRYEITGVNYVPGEGGEITAVVTVNLYYLRGEDWSSPIPGIGSAKYVVAENKGMYTDDESVKKALTDAISVACKALGIGADVYWSAGSKYSTVTGAASLICADCGRPIAGLTAANGETLDPADVAGYTRVVAGRRICYDCLQAFKARRKAEKAAAAQATAQAGDNTPAT